MSSGPPAAARSGVWHLGRRGAVAVAAASRLGLARLLHLALGRLGALARASPSSPSSPCSALLVAPSPSRPRLRRTCPCVAFSASASAALARFAFLAFARPCPAWPPWPRPWRPWCASPSSSSLVPPSRRPGGPPIVAPFAGSAPSPPRLVAVAGGRGGRAMTAAPVAAGQVDGQRWWSPVSGPARPDRRPDRRRGSAVGRRLRTTRLADCGRLARPRPHGRPPGRSVKRSGWIVSHLYSDCRPCDAM